MGGLLLLGWDNSIIVIMPTDDISQCGSYSKLARLSSGSNRMLIMLGNVFFDL